MGFRDSTVHWVYEALQLRGIVGDMRLYSNGILGILGYLASKLAMRDSGIKKWQR